MQGISKEIHQNMMMIRGIFRRLVVPPFFVSGCKVRIDVYKAHIEHRNAYI